MVNLLIAYRQIITEMDSLLVQASRTAERLGISDAAELPSPPAVPPPRTAPSLARTAAERRPHPPSNRPPRDRPGTVDHFPSGLNFAESWSPPRSWSPPPTTAPPLQRSSISTSTTAASQQQRSVVDTSAPTATASMTNEATSVGGYRGAMLGRSPVSAASRVAASGSRAHITTSSTPADRRPATTSRASASSTATRRTSASTRVPNTSGRGSMRAGRAVPPGVGPLEDRPLTHAGMHGSGLTQAEALQLRSGTDWSQFLSTRQETLSASRRTSMRPGSTRRPRTSALFSQAARFTFPGRRSSGD